MITNVSIVNVFVQDQDEAKRFYIDVLGFAEKDDVTLGPGYRWCTVAQPHHPELLVSLVIPGPPMTAEFVEAITRAQNAGGVAGLGFNVDDCEGTCRELTERGSPSCSRQRSGPTASRRCAATTPATGWSWSSPPTTIPTVASP